MSQIMSIMSIMSQTPKNVSQRVAQWEKKVMEERESEIFKRLQNNQKEVSKEAEEAEMKQEELWRESGHKIFHKH